MNHVAIIALALALGLMAFFGGGSYTWATGAAAALAAVAAMLALRGRSRVFEGPAGGGHVLACPENVIVLTIVIATLSAVPMPRFSWGAMGSWRAEQNATVADALNQAAEQDLLPSMLPLCSFSRNMTGTQRATVRFAAMALCGILAALHPPGKRQRVAVLLVLLGLLVSALGCVSLWWKPQGNSLWWIFDVPKHHPGPVACFINRNHFGGFAAMLAPVALLMGVDAVTRRRWLAALLGGVAFGITSVACIASLSRGAMIAYAAGMLACIAAMLVSRRFKSAAVLLGAAGIAAAMLLRTGGPELRERVASLSAPATTLSGQYRLDAWRDGVDIWRYHPIAGVGLNAFPMAYPLYRTTSDSAYMSHAENEYVQLLAETGLIGFVLLALLLHTVGTSVVRSRAPASDAWLKSSCAAATVVVAVHAVVDSALHIPLYAATYGAIIGLAMPSPAARTEGGRQCPPPVLMVCGLVALVFGLVLKPLHWNDSLRFCRTADPEPLARALMGAPTSRPHWYHVGRSTYDRSIPASRDFADLCLTQAGAYDLQNYRLWSSIGKFRLRIKDYDGAREAYARVRELRDWVPIPDIPEGAE